MAEKSSPNGFTWNTDSAAYTEGHEGKPNRYSAPTEYPQWVDWLHGRMARDEERRARHG